MIVIVEANLDQQFDYDLILPACFLLVSTLGLFRCLFYLPTSIVATYDTAARISSLDAKEIELDFSSVITAQSPLNATSNIVVQQRFEGFHNTGLAVWGDSVSLACYLLQPSLLLSEENLYFARRSNAVSALNRVVSMLPNCQDSTQSWIEVGCGAGVLALTLSKFSHLKKFVATDGDEATLKLVAENIKRNVQDETITVKRLRWGNDSDQACLGTYDIVVGSDLTYWPAPMDQLLISITKLVKQNGTVIIAHKDRQHSKATKLDFFRDLKTMFKQCACAHVLDQRSPGLTGGDVTEEAGMWIYVARDLCVPDN